MRTVCVFCGAADGPDPSYVEAARRFGRDMAGAGVRVVYGGAGVGMMGALADGALEGGGDVVSVVPEILDWPEARYGLVKDIRVVPTLFERKRTMFDLSDAFAVLPGGTGTLDEALEVLSWSQLGMEGLDRKPILFLNHDDYFGPLRIMLFWAVQKGFMREEDFARARFVHGAAFSSEVLSALGVL